MREPMIALTGMLKSDGSGGYTLVDQASGDSIVLKRKAKKLGEYDQQNVTVLGRWKGGDESSKTFKVSKVEAAPAEAATQSAQPSTSTVNPADSTQSTVPESTGVPETSDTPPDSTQAPEATESPDSPQSPDSAPSPDGSPSESPAPSTP
jgi:hypothetical protein